MKKQYQIIALLLLSLILLSFSSCTYAEEKVEQAKRLVGAKIVEECPPPKCALVSPKTLSNYTALQSAAQQLSENEQFSFPSDIPWLTSYRNYGYGHESFSPQTLGSAELYDEFCLVYVIIFDYFETFETKTKDLSYQQKKAYTDAFIGVMYYEKEYCKNNFQDFEWIEVCDLTNSIIRYLVKHHEEYSAKDELFRTMLADCYPVKGGFIFDGSDEMERWIKVQRCRRFYLSGGSAEKGLEMIAEFYDWESNSRLK